jgi:uncharacterized protein (DUF486 family)
MMVAHSAASQSVAAAIGPENRKTAALRIRLALASRALLRFDGCPTDQFPGPGPMRTIILLTISNIFMTFAWYGHLKYKDQALWLVILASWGIAFFEYCFQVPANRWGHGQFSTTQLKVMQEVITLSVFCIFVLLYMREPIRWNYLAGFACLIAAVIFVFAFREDPVARSAASIQSQPDASPLLVPVKNASDSGLGDELSSR